MLLRFGDYEIDEAALELTRGGEPVPLSPMAVRMLTYFARRSGALVTRQALYDALWPEGCVDRERLVNTYVRQIRAALDERAGEDRFLKTYPRRGYRFLPDTVVVPSAETGDPGSAHPQDGPPRALASHHLRPGAHNRPRLLAASGVLALLVLVPVLARPGTEAASLDVTPGGLAYEMGRELLSHPLPDQRAGSVEFFRTAVSEAPDYASAHAGLAEGLYWSGDVSGAGDAARRALELDPAHPRAHMVLGSTLLTEEWDWGAAERHFREAVSGAPDDPDPGVALAYLLVSAGRDREALDVLERATALEPTSAAVTGDLGILYGWLGEHRQALELCRRTIAIEPAASWGHACAMEAAGALGHAQEVRARARSLIELAGDDPAELLLGPVDIEEDMRALRRYQLGRPHGSHFGRAVAMAAVGMRAEAVTALREAARNREPGVVALGSEPALRRLEGEPGYDVLRNRVFAKLRVTTPGA